MRITALPCCLSLSISTSVPSSFITSLRAKRMTISSLVGRSTMKLERHSSSVSARLYTRRFLNSTSALSLVTLMVDGAAWSIPSVAPYCLAPHRIPFTYSSIRRLPDFMPTTKAIFSWMPLANFVPTSVPPLARIRASCVVSCIPTPPFIQSTTRPLRSVTFVQVSSSS